MIKRIKTKYLLKSLSLAVNIVVYLDFLNIHILFAGRELLSLMVSHLHVSFSLTPENER